MALLYHYTSEEKARAILAEESTLGLYVTVGSGNWFGDGFYATPIPPVDDPDCLRQVIADCFFGGRTQPEVSWVLVLRSECLDHVFEECPDPQHWMIPGSPMEIIWLSELLEAVSRFRGGVWETVWTNEGV